MNLKDPTLITMLQILINQLEGLNIFVDNL